MDVSSYRILQGILILTNLVTFSIAKSGLCEVEGSQSGSNIIVDVEESRGSQLNQTTTPAELPVSGDPYSEISLSLAFQKGRNEFVLRGKRLQLTAPLDRDAENLSHIVFQLVCTVRATNKKKTIPIILRVSDINDNAPKFINTPYSTSVSELAQIGTTVFKDLKAVDKDAGVNSLVEYSIVQGDGKDTETTNGVGKDRINVADGFGYFSINLPHQGQVTVNRSLDYEKTQRYLLTVIASVRHCLSVPQTIMVLTRNQLKKLRKSSKFKYDFVALERSTMNRNDDNLEADGDRKIKSSDLTNVVSAQTSTSSSTSVLYTGSRMDTTCQPTYSRQHVQMTPFVSTNSQIENALSNATSTSTSTSILYTGSRMDTMCQPTYSREHNQTTPFASTNSQMDTISQPAYSQTTPLVSTNSQTDTICRPVCSRGHVQMTPLASTNSQTDTIFRPVCSRGHVQMTPLASTNSQMDTICRPVCSRGHVQMTPLVSTNSQIENVMNNTVDPKNPAAPAENHPRLGKGLMYTIGFILFLISIKSIPLESTCSSTFFDYVNDFMSYFI